MPRLRALVSSANRKAGEEFEASEAHAKMLTAADLIGGQRAELVDRSMRAADEPTPKQAQSADEVVDSKRRYLRRDMRARK